MGRSSQRKLKSVTSGMKIFWTDFGQILVLKNSGTVLFLCTTNYTQQHKDTHLNDGFLQGNKIAHQQQFMSNSRQKYCVSLSQLSYKTQEEQVRLYAISSDLPGNLVDKQNSKDRQHARLHNYVTTHRPSGPEGFIPNMIIRGQGTS